MPHRANKLQRFWNKSFIYIKKYVSAVTNLTGLNDAPVAALLVGDTMPGAML
jgi:hypothetical protein